MDFHAFLDAASERGKDANTLWESGRHPGALYMIGYQVECTLKAHLQQQSKPFPTSGAGGHDLRSLWEAAGLRLSDLQGPKRYFMDMWTTALRYRRLTDEEERNIQVLRQGALELVRYINTRQRRWRQRR